MSDRKKMLCQKEQLFALTRFKHLTQCGTGTLTRLHSSGSQSHRLFAQSFSFLYFLVSLFFAQHAYSADTAQPPEMAGLNESVFLLKGLSHKSSCGTGFLLEQKYLITNAHLIENLCPQKVCNNLSVWRTSHSGPLATSLLSAQKFILRQKLRVLDLAVIEILPELPWSSYFKLDNQVGRDLTSDMPAEMAGFPGCEELKNSSGILQEMEVLHFLSTLRGKHGSSGSPLSLSDGSLVGIADEADSFLDASLSKLFHTGFSMRAVRANHLGFILRHLDQADALLKFEAELLMKHYQTQVSSRSNLTRILKGAEFQFLIKELLADYQFLKKPLTLHALFGTRPEKTLDLETLQPGQARDSLLLSLIFLANVENYGISDFDSLHKLVFNSPLLEDQNRRQILQALLAESPAGINRILNLLCLLGLTIIFSGAFIVYKICTKQGQSKKER